MSTRTSHFTGSLLILALCGGSGVALGDDWLFTTNNAGPDGVRLTLDTITMGSSTDVPCVDALRAVEWAPDGTSSGIDRNRRFGNENRIWVSINSDLHTDCSGSTGDICIGASWYQIDSPPASGYASGWAFTTEFTAAGGVAPDIVADYPVFVVPEKSPSGTIEQWDTSSSSGLTASGISEASQAEWLGSDFYVVTEAGTQEEVCDATASGGSGTGTTDVGNLWLMHKTSSTVIDSLAVPLPSGFTSGDDWGKPEGVDGGYISASMTHSCIDSDATRSIFVTDWCTNHLHIFTTDLNASPVEMSYDGDFDLEASSSLTSRGTCKPSVVYYNQVDDEAFVVCQGRDTVIRLDMTDPCDPVWDDEEVLQESTGSSTASCSTLPTVQDCSTGSYECQPHGIGHGDLAHPEWIFVAVSYRNRIVGPPLVIENYGHILAIRRSDLSEQYVIYRDFSGDYEPMDAEILPSSPP